MVDDYYGYKPETLKYESALKRLQEKKKNKEERKKRQLAMTQMFTEAEEKSKMTRLERFIAQYMYYIDKILWSRADPFLQEKRRQYQEQFESYKLNKFANVFNRLNFDTKERRK